MSKAAVAVNGHADLFDLRNEAAPSAKEHGSSKKQLKVSALPINAILKDEMHAVVAQPERETPAFFVADVAEVLNQLKRWRKALPRVHPFMAIKCNPDAVFMQALAQEGTGFDCASQEEIAAVLQLGVEPDRIIYANPTKQSSMIKYAQQVGVQMMTFDNAEELYKVAKHHPQADMVLRILVDDSKSIMKFGAKFGASMDSVHDLLKTAIDLNISVIGVSFHVGSGCMDAEAFGEAVANARKVFDQAAALGKPMNFLDVGGGFPGSAPSHGSITFEEIAAVLGPAIDKHFDASVRVIAEPGRYFVSAAMTLATQITSRRTVTVKGEANPSYMYYINDGVYGSFNCIMFDHAKCIPNVLLQDNKVVLSDITLAQKEKFACSIWGPTCDSMDCITKEGLLPKLDVGDWLYFENMGAYTNAAASTFNGFKRSNVIYTKST